MQSSLLLVACHLMLFFPSVTSFANDTTCTVSSSGHDHPKCLAGSSSSCLTLEYVLSNSRGCAVVTVLESQNLTSPVIVASPQDLAIIGNKTKTTVFCKNSSGLVFNSPLRILLENLRFIGCAARHHDSDGYPLVEYAGLYFYQGSDVQIIGCVFSDGTGTGVIMYDVIGKNNLLRGSYFIGSKPGAGEVVKNRTFGGLFIKRIFVTGDAVYTIEECDFFGNENHGNESNLGGGGMTVELAAPSSTSHFIIRTSWFKSNKGSQGGGIFVNQSGASSSAIFDVVHSHFLLNNAHDAGGGMYLQQNEASSCSCLLNINNTYFVENDAEWGGGLAVYNGNSNGSVRVEAFQAVWTGNKASRSGFGVGLSARNEKTGRPSNQTAFLLDASFDNCIFQSDSEKIIEQKLTPVGAVHVGGCKVEFHDSKFQHIYGTALYLLDSSYAVFSGNTSFVSNTHAIQGGAIYMDTNSLLSLKPPVVLQFQNNSAIEEGGAIYSEAVHGLDTPNIVCIFESLSSLLNSSGNVTVIFSHNIANGENRAVFVGSPESCISKSSKKNQLFGKSVFSYYPNQTSQVSSTANSISFDTMPRLKDGKYLEVMLGELFYLIPNATDIFHNRAHVSGNLELMTDDHFRLVGPNFIGLDNFTQNNKLYLAGNQITEDTELSLHFIYNMQSSYHKGDVKVNMKVVKCRIGFWYNSSSQLCQCNSAGNLMCPNPRSYACVKYSYWYGRYDQTGDQPILCPWMNCNYTDGKCPHENCPNYPSFCRIDVVDDLCLLGRGGLLCSGCRANYSFTFGASSCVPSHKCPPVITALITLGVIAYWIVFVLFVLVILNLDLSIGSGFMYGIIYYFSILNLFTESSVTDSFLMVLVDICTALTQLSPRAFGNINACFVPNWNLNLHHKLFHFVSPAFVFAVVVIIILASRYCRCPRIISLAENSPIHAICMLVLFSYTSMVYTIFYILKPIKIKGEWRVFIDPDLGYFHKEHLPYALVALLCELLLTLPICLLLLFAPWLSRRVNLVKLRLKPVLDEFQACYRPRYRWFAGFYFLARQLVFLASVIPLPQQSIHMNVLVHCTNGLILLIHATFQPYKFRWLNIFDSLLLFDIFLLSFFQLEWNSNFLYRAIPYILILPPSMYLILAVLLIMFKRALQCLRSTTFFGKNIQRMSRKPPTELPSRVHSVTRTSVGMDEDLSDPESIARSEVFEGSGFFRDYGEREPLLSGSDPEQVSHSRSARMYTTTSLRIDKSVDPPNPNKFPTN